MIMEYMQSSWQHTDFTPATCPKCGRMVFAIGGDGDLSKQCFSCRRDIGESRKDGDDARNVKRDFTEGKEASNDNAQSKSDKPLPIGDKTKYSKKKTPRKTKPKQQGFVTDENDVDDDTSSQHSNSSLTTKKRTKRPSRRYCEIHSRRARKSYKDGETGEDLGEIATNNLDDTTDNCSVSQNKCTCRKFIRKRPEPEGGLAHASFMDEYDRIIYNNDPLFSDVDDNPELEAKILQDVERHHSQFRLRSGNAASCVTDSIFSAAQMVNSNTSLKFAIIQVELKNLDVSLGKVNNETACEPPACAILRLSNSTAPSCPETCVYIHSGLNRGTLFRLGGAEVSRC